MARQLWLLRHGEAEPHGERPDAERRLTARGEEQSRVAGRALAALELRFQAALTSPKVRALDTAKLACAQLAIEPVVFAPLGDGFEAADGRALVGEDERVLAVGHNPDLSEVVHDLTGAAVELKKGGVAGIALEGTRGRLIALLRPRELERIV